VYKINNYKLNNKEVPIMLPNQLNEKEEKKIRHATSPICNKIIFTGG
jgi:hypothetical protein